MRVRGLESSALRREHELAFFVAEAWAFTI